MTDPTIRAALEAAEYYPDTASRIAAFLRRLDALVPQGAMCGPDGGEIYTADLRHLAAAVEQAAKEASDA